MPTSEVSTDDLHAYLDALTRAVDVGADTVRPAPTAPRRWAPVLVGAAAAVAVAFAVAALLSGDDRRSVDAVDRPDVEESGGSEAGVPVPGTWRPLEDVVPVADSYMAAFWTGNEMVAVYPENEGGDVTVQVWDENLENPRIASPSNLPWRASPTIVWTGTEVLVLGGSSGPGIERPAVAYDPSADRWRDLTPPPGFVPGKSDAVAHDGVWTGTEVVFPAQGLTYRPDSDSWHDLPPAPDGTIRPGGAVVATNDHVVVWGGCPADVTTDICESEQLATGGGAVLDLAEETWQVLPPGGPAPGAEVQGAWTGAEVVLVSTRTGRDEPTGTVAAYDPAADDWRTLPDPPFRTTFRTRLVSTPTSSVLPAGVVLVGEGMPASVLDAGSAVWRQLGAELFRSGTAVTWAGSRLVVIGNTYVFEPLDGVGDPDGDAQLIVELWERLERASDDGLDSWAEALVDSQYPGFGATVEACTYQAPDGPNFRVAYEVDPSSIKPEPQWTVPELNPASPMSGQTPAGRIYSVTVHSSWQSADVHDVSHYVAVLDGKAFSFPICEVD